MVNEAKRFPELKGLSKGDVLVLRYIGKQANGTTSLKVSEELSLKINAARRITCGLKSAGYLEGEDPVGGTTGRQGRSPMIYTLSGKGKEYLESISAVVVQSPTIAVKPAEYRRSKVSQLPNSVFDLARIVLQSCE